MNYSFNHYDDLLNLFNQLNKAIIILSDIKIIAINKPTAKLFKLESDLLIGKTLLDFSPKFQQDTRSDVLINQYLEKTEQYGHTDFHWNYVDGKSNQILSKVNLNYGTINSKPYMIALLDSNVFVPNASQSELITHSKDLRTRLLLYIKENKGVSLFESSTLPLCISDYEGNIIKLNKAWTDVTGWEITDLRFHPFMAFIHPDDLKSTVETFKFLLDGIEILGFQNRYIKKDGETISMQWYAFPDTINKEIFTLGKVISTK